MPKIRVAQERGGVERMVKAKTAQVESMKQRIIEDLSGSPEQAAVVTITETMVGGGSTNALIKMANELIASRRFPNLRIKILALQQTMQAEGSGAGVVEITQRGIAEADKVRVIVSAVRYILGEDVSYQSARTHADSRAPVIVFKPTAETMCAYQIIPVGETTAHYRSSGRQVQMGGFRTSSS